MRGAHTPRCHRFGAWAGAGCRGRPPARRRAQAAARAPAAADAPAAPPPGREDALLLAYLASQNKSLFAAQCFAEAVLDAYSRGEKADELQTALALKNAQQGGQLLEPGDQDILLSWVLMVMLTAREVGLPAGPGQQQQQEEEEEQQQQGQQQDKQQQQQQQPPDRNATAAAAGAGVTEQYSAQALGLLQFVKQATQLYFDQGYTVQRLQSLQAAVASDPGQGRSQFLQLMQQYTLLVVITLEVAAACGLPSSRPLCNPTTLGAPSGYTAAFGGEGAVTAAAAARGRVGVRAMAVRLMTAFVGAVIGSPFSFRSFVTLALEAYELGVPVAELHGQLGGGEFLQSGGLVPIVPRPEVQQDANQQLFGRWLSLVYMAAAQLNAVFPGAAERPGWAWYGGEDEVQANAMAGFVAQTLVRLQAEEAEAAGAEGGIDQDRPQELDPLAAKIRSSPDASAALEAASRELQQELRERGTLRGKELPLMVRVPDPELGATSSALMVWRQQVELVQAVYAYMKALQAVAL